MFWVLRLADGPVGDNKQVSAPITPPSYSRGAGGAAPRVGYRLKYDSSIIPQTLFDLDFPQRLWNNSNKGEKQRPRFSR
jgi:hypothetical protein